MADAKLKIVIDAVNNAQAELSGLKKQLEGVSVSSETASKKSGGFLNTIKAMQGQLIAVGGSLAAFGVAAKKAWDWAQEGAAIAQTEQSFDRLGVSIEAMRNAARGTVDDMTLMKGTLTLTAGASETLQKQLLGSAPQLMEIAKAANALNPTLGDTAYMYESIATGIKRGSPLILDNLGIVVKIGEANERYAEALGKSVEELTAEEKQIALLNGTLEAGQRLIEQNGGSVDSLTDSYSQLGVAWKNNIADLKMMLGQSGLGGLLTNYTETLSLLPQMRKEYGYVRTAYESFFNVLGGNGTIFEEHLEQMAREEELAKANATATTRYEDTQRALIQAQIGNGQSAEYMMRVGQEYAAWAETDAKQAVLAHADALERQEAALKAASAEYERISWAVGEDFTASMEKGKVKVDELRARVEELKGQIATTDDEADLSKLQAELAETRGEIDATIEEMKRLAAEFTLRVIEMQITADGKITEVEARMYSSYAYQMGLIDETALHLSDSVAQIMADLADKTITEEEAMRRLIAAAKDAEGAYTDLSVSSGQSLRSIIDDTDEARAKMKDLGLSAQAAQLLIDQMHGKKIEMEVHWSETNRPSEPGGGAPVGGGGQWGWNATGGMPGLGYTMVGERGPELVKLPLGSQVFNHQTTNQTNNYYQTVNTRATSGTVRQDFALLRALG